MNEISDLIEQQISDSIFVRPNEVNILRGNPVKMENYLVRNFPIK